MVVSKFFKIPYSTLTYGIDVWNLNGLKLAGLRRSRRIIVISNYTREVVLEQMNSYPKDRISLLPPTFDPRKFEPKPKPQHLMDKWKIKNDNKILLTISRLSKTEKYKGYDRIIMAMKDIVKEVPNVKYILVGSGDDMERIKRLIKDNNLEDKVFLTGFIPDEEIVDYYNLCDVFVMPSKGEGFGIVFLEALACGKPVIAGNKDGSVDAVLGGETGLLVDPDNLEEIKDAVIRVLKGRVDSKLLDRAYLRSRTIEEYGFESFRERVKAVYNTKVMQMSSRLFYDQQYRDNEYIWGGGLRQEATALQAFVESFGLKDKRILEIGCGRGDFQGIVENWIGVDIAYSVRGHIKKPFTVASANALPFYNESFDALWSITTLEHVPEPEHALSEIIRVLRPGGVAYLAPAWHCRPWAAKGYHVRPWSDFDWMGKLIKASIPLRNTLWFRAAHTLTRRVWREILFLLKHRRPLRFHYRKLKANYGTYWCSDSDACNSMDPHEMLLWFRSRGWNTPSHPTWLSRFIVRHGAIIVQKPLMQKQEIEPSPLKNRTFITSLTGHRSYRLAVLTSHVIQYQVPLFRALAARPEINLTVYFCSEWGVKEYVDPGFGKKFKWDIPMLDGYRYRFLRNWSPFSAPGRFLGVINPGIVSELLRHKFDAVIIHGYALASYWFGYIGAWLSKTPVFFRGETVLRPDRPWWVRAVKRFFLSILFRGTAAFLTIGSRSHEFYKALRISNNRLFFTPYTVDNDFFMSESHKWKEEKVSLKISIGIPEELPVILFVGKLIERKRPFDLLYAYEGIKDMAGLIFVGDGLLRLTLQQYAKEKGLSRVIFVGFKNQSELPKYYAVADIFVLPSSSKEVSPLVLNEAMCCALPIVVSDAIPSAVDFVKRGDNGYTYPCGNINRLRGILHELVIDKELRNSMGLRSQEIIKKWNISKVVEGILEALSVFGRRK
jgi:glycosyltransferase involved in cell wall biosynthesis